MIVCFCNALKEAQLRAAARGGAGHPVEAYASLGCKPRCGQCLPFAREVMADEARLSQAA
ncbi:(2Fe-2S)-binding protein [Glacieibacterium sp.]|uniref:(2Fe-2S)-binding protein n=1 Tax=Glacieibacterium sp. TaxID=2860237 RepID=UPI003B009A3E